MPYKSNRIGDFPRNKMLVFGTESMQNYPFYLRQSGETELCRNIYCQRTDTGYWSVEYVLEGEFFYSDETESFKLHKGDFYLLKPRGTNMLRCTSQRAVKLCLGFHGRMLIPMLESLHIGAPGAKHFRMPDDDLALSLQAEAAALHPVNTVEKREKLVQFTLKVMMLISRMFEKKRLPDNLLNILDHISVSISKKIELEELAAVGNVSVVTVIRLFASYLQTTPGEYIRRKRLESACELLRMPEYSIKEVAGLLGYSSPQYLATDFRKQYGMSPREFQKNPSEK